LAALPSLTLFLGSLVFIGWRVTDRRRAWLAESGFTAAALAADLSLWPGLPAEANLPLWSADLSGSSAVGLRLTAPIWGLLALLLSHGLAVTASSGGVAGVETARQRAARLAVLGAASLGVASSTTLTFVLTWALGSAALAWLRAESDPSDRAMTPWRLVGGGDVGGVMLLVAAFALAAIEGAQALATSALLGAAVLKAMPKAPGSAEGSGARWTHLRSVLPGSAMAVGLVARGFDPAMLAASGGLIAAAGAVMLFAGAVVFWLGEKAGARLPAFALASLGASVAAVALGPRQAEVAAAAGGATMLVAGTLAFGPRAADRAGRLAPIAAGLAISAIPFLPGATLLDVLSAPSWPSAVGVATTMGLVLLGAGAIFEGLTGEAAADREASSLGVLSVVVMLGVGALTFSALHAGRAAVAGPLNLVAPAIAVGAALVMRLVPANRRRRVARAMRGPAVLPLAAWLGAGGRALGRAIREGRDVLEGDASILWAFVVVLVAFLMLRAAA